jgi:hypothetical protein
MAFGVDEDVDEQEAAPARPPTCCGAQEVIRACGAAGRMVSGLKMLIAEALCCQL